MSFGIGDSNKRPGIFDTFRTAMTPPPLPEDDGQPIARPRVVAVASLMSILAGVVFLLIGGVSLFTTDDQLNNAVAAYNKQISECTTKFGGIGDATAIQAGASEADVALAETCKQYRPLTDEAISAAKTQNIMISAIIVVIGALAIAGGWFIRSGARFSRLIVAGGVVISVLVTMMFQVSNIFTLAATLVMIIAVMLCFVGKGAVYFARLKARRTG